MKEKKNHIKKRRTKRTQNPKKVDGPIYIPDIPSEPVTDDHQKDHQKNHENLTGKQKRLKNLRPRPPWKKGQSGNPKGRLKGASLTELLRSFSGVAIKDIPALGSMAQRIGLGKDATVADLLVRTTALNAMKGNATAIREVWDRHDGKAEENISMKIAGEVRFPAHDLSDPEIKAALLVIAEKQAESVNKP